MNSIMAISSQLCFFLCGCNCKFSNKTDSTGDKCIQNTDAIDLGSISQTIIFCVIGVICQGLPGKKCFTGVQQQTTKIILHSYMEYQSMHPSLENQRNPF